MTLSCTLVFRLSSCLHSREELFKPRHTFQALFFSLHPSQFCTFTSLTIPMLLPSHMLLYYYIITICYYYYYTTTDLRIQTEIFYNNEHQKISSLVHRGLTAPLTLPHEGTKCSRPMNNILKFPPLTKLKHPIFLQ